MDMRDQSEFNAGIAFLNRMNLWFFYAEEASINMDGNKWFHVLNVIKRELHDDMQKEEQERANGYMIDINKIINSLSPKKKEFYSHIILPSGLYLKLDEYDTYLREIYRKAGYKTKFKDDPRYAL